MDFNKIVNYTNCNTFTNNHNSLVRIVCNVRRTKSSQKIGVKSHFLSCSSKCCANYLMNTAVVSTWRKVFMSQKICKSAIILRNFIRKKCNFCTQYSYIFCEKKNSLFLFHIYVEHYKNKKTVQVFFRMENNERERSENR